MRKIFYWFLVFTVILHAHPLWGQKMFWSDMNVEDREEALQINNQFFDYLKNARYDKTNRLLNSKEIFVGNGSWLRSEAFIDEIKKTGNPDRFSTLKSRTYTFDEFLNDHIDNPLIRRIYEVFDNHSRYGRLSNATFSG